MDHLTEIEAAWLAGLFEGECCIDVNAARKTKVYHRLRVVMTDQDVLERAANIIGREHCTLIPESYKRMAHHKSTWVLSVHKKAVLGPLLARLLPYFGERRSAKVREVLANLA